MFYIRISINNNTRFIQRMQHTGSRVGVIKLIVTNTTINFILSKQVVISYLHVLCP